VSSAWIVRDAAEKSILSEKKDRKKEGEAAQEIQGNGARV